MFYTPFTEKLLRLQEIKVTLIKNDKSVTVYTALERKMHKGLSLVIFPLATAPCGYAVSLMMLFALFTNCLSLS